MPLYALQVEKAPPINSPVIPDTPGERPVERDFIALFQRELDEYYAEMKQLTGYEPDEVFMKLAGWSARASEIRTNLVRQESRRSAAFRTREIEPFIEECDRQFRIYSRIQAAREFDLKMANGRYT